MCLLSMDAKLSSQVGCLTTGVSSLSVSSIPIHRGIQGNDRLTIWSSSKHRRMTNWSIFLGKVAEPHTCA